MMAAGIVYRVVLVIAALSCIHAFVSPSFSKVTVARKLVLRPCPSLQLRGGGPLLSLRKFFQRGDKTKMAAAASPPRIIIAGGPASGKGTQCEFIVQKFGVVHISTGDALREQVKAGTELGKQAKGFMDSGGLVPDDLIIGIVKARLASSDCQTKGWLLDGFPRTGGQAEALANAGIKADKFILLNVPDELLIERCVGRRSDPVTGKIYHLKFNPPPNDAEVVARLVHRSDDTAEAMTKRIEQYKKNVEAVKGYYTGICREFDGTGDKMKLAGIIADFIATAPATAKEASEALERLARLPGGGDPIQWDARTAGSNVTILPSGGGGGGGGGGVVISGSGTVIAVKGIAALPSAAAGAAGGEQQRRLYWEYDVEETGRGSWVGVVGVPAGAAAAAATAGGLAGGGGGVGGAPDLNLSLSGIGWGIWGGTTGAFHPMYTAGKVRGQTVGFRAGRRVGLLLDAAAGTLTYFLDGEELCVAFDDLPTGAGLPAAAALGGVPAALAGAAAAAEGGGGVVLYPAASNGWAGVTRVMGRFRPGPPTAGGQS